MSQAVTCRPVRVPALPKVADEAGGEISIPSGLGSSISSRSADSAEFALGSGSTLAAVGETRRAVAWVKDDPFGVEFAEIALAPQRVAAEGVAIAAGPIPYRLDYMLETAPGYLTSRLWVTSRGEGWGRTLDLRRDASGIWTATAHEEGRVDLPPAGGDPATLKGALDCDLGLSPVTNLMPILRHKLLTGGHPVELTMAWVSVPDLSVRGDGQRYASLRTAADHRVIRYEASDGTFAADITLDSDGIVIDYPGIARRLQR
jgi:hypothetical protein